MFDRYMIDRWQYILNSLPYAIHMDSLGCMSHLGCKNHSIWQNFYWMLGYKILCYLKMLWWKLYWYLSSLLSSSTSSSSYPSSFFCSLSPILHPVWHFLLNIYCKLTANKQPFSLYSFNSANSYSSKCLSVLSNAYKWMKDKLYWIACLEAGYVIC